MNDDVRLAGAEQDILPDRIPFRLSSAPIVAVVASLSVGILCDRFTTVGHALWLIASAGLSLLWLLLWMLHRDRLASAVVCLTWIAVGGTIHHQAWSLAAADDVLAYATEVPSPIELTGVIETRPSIRAADSPETSVLPTVDRTQCVVRIQSVRMGPATRPCSGKVQLVVRGHLASSNTGDTVQIKGRISRPNAPGNPGDFDYRAYLRRQGIHCVVRAGDPSAVETISTASSLKFDWWRNRARYIASDILYSALDEDTYPIASAILLGDRDYVTRTIRSSFAQSGTMHLLAISGLHIGILAITVWRTTRLLHLSLRAETAVVLICLWGYAVITDVRPSVLRATVLATCIMGSRLWFRQTRLSNSLGCAALIVLLCKPTDLFDVGAQLSFVAVAAIAWVNSTFPVKFQPGDILQPWWERAARRLVFVAKSDLRMMLVASATTAPLTAFAFNLYTPIGLTINVLLIHLVAIIMIAGYATLLFGYFLPFAVEAPAFVFSFGLKVLHRTAALGSSFQSGHHFGPGPSLSFTIATYTLFTILVACQKATHRWIAMAAITILIIIGLAKPLVLPPANQLRCTVIDVGHGSCILVENPEGQTLLVDIGSMDSPLRAARAAQGCLWEYGYAGLDTLAITHADLDHFNGTTEFLKETSVGSIIAPALFLKSTEPGAVEIHEAAKQCGLPIQTVQSGQPVALGSAKISVLHPGETATNEFEDDNAASLVLLIEFAGRRLLLTGDVSGNGQRDLMSKAIEPVDFLLAPHHGSKKDNDAKLAAWASPGIVVASCRNRSTQRLEEVYPQAEVYSTARDGAISITVRDDGHLSVSAYRRQLADWF